MTVLTLECQKQYAYIKKKTNSSCLFYNLILPYYINVNKVDYAIIYKRWWLNVDDLSLVK